MATFELPEIPEPSVSPNMLVGMDCLEPGQLQPTHQHAGRDKMYYVIEGEGEFTIGAEARRNVGEAKLETRDQHRTVERLEATAKIRC